MFENSPSGFLRSMPPVTKNLLIINILMWAVTVFVPGFDDTLMRIFALHYWDSPDFNVAQFVTYMFLHGGFVHLFFNMFSLYMFGPLLERVLGSKNFLVFYFVCGIGAALIQEGTAALTIMYVQSDFPADVIDRVYAEGYSLVQRGLTYQDPDLQMLHQAVFSHVVGASGAIFGLLLGFAFVFPNMPLYFMFIPMPVKAKWMVIGYAVLEFWFGVSGQMASVAHFAHLGGMLFALPMLLYWKKKEKLGGGFYG